MAGAEAETWVGRSQRARDHLDANRANALRATLESKDPPLGPGDRLPELWHWCYFWSAAPQSGLGPDGHAARGEFLPPIELPRRMWAGSRLRWHRPLVIGDALERRSEIVKVERKTGRSGPLAFVTLRHLYGPAEEVALEEEHDIVYRAAVAGEAGRTAEMAQRDAPWRRSVRPDPVLLFRYSALTFNGHRIHYDHPYATAREGYPDLVVHGPLLATLMVELARRQAAGRGIAAFTFRARSPLFANRPFEVLGRPEGEEAALWVAGPDGALAMEGRLTYGAGEGTSGAAGGGF